MKKNSETRRKWYRLTRGKRIVRNLVLALVLAVFAWGIYGFPLPVEAAFRRLEREHLLEPGEIALLLQPEWGKEYATVSVNGQQYSSNGVICAAVSPDWIFCSAGTSRTFDPWEIAYFCSRGDGVDVIPLAHYMVTTVDYSTGRLDLKSYMPYLVLDLDVPAETVRVEMDMEYRMDGRDGEKTVMTTGAGEKQESGAWLFFLDRPNGSAYATGQIGAPWIIRAYAADGTLLQEIEGTVREYSVG